MRRLAPALLLAYPCAAAAHGFGQRYDLPLPLALYACGAALTIVVSCVMFAIYARAPRPQGYARWDLLSTTIGRAIASPGSIAVLRFANVLLFLFLLFAGFLGNQNAFKNVVPVMVWAIGWVGMAYFSALVGDAWKVVNPFETIFAAAERHAPRAAPRLRLPAWVEAWPAVALYLLFLWLETSWPGADSPRGIATAMAAYAVATWIGMWLFGREEWLARGEVFSLVYGILARFAPSHVELESRRVTALHLRPYAVGLFEKAPLDTSRTALVIVMLAAVTFDGFLETPAWSAIAEMSAGEDSHFVRTAGLFLMPLLFGLVYFVFCRLTALAGGMPAGASRERIAGLFVLTLVPIAIAYMLAHYLTFIVQAAQYLLPLASDPLGWGWNIFSTANVFVRVSILDARFVWIASVTVIVVGHVAALYLAHSLSMREFPDRASARRSQFPMLVLMVAYTMSSLWIIAQPIVSSR